jgi:purine-binding chemotaxis protein CheW
MSPTVTIDPCEAVVFEAATQRFAVRCRDVREIQRSVALNSSPGQRPAVAGAFNLRGRVVPVIDVRALIGRPTAPIRVSDQLIVVEAGDSLVALLAERTIGLVSLSAADVDGHDGAAALCQDPTEALGQWVRVDDGLVLLIDPLRALAALTPTMPSWRQQLGELLPPSLRPRSPA